MDNKRNKEQACYISGNKFAKDEMIKIVKAPDERWCFDVKQNLPGESFYLTNSHKIMRQFLDIIGGNVTLGQDIEKYYLNQLLSIVSMAKKSGNLILGKEKVKSYSRKSGIILQATDASTREKFSVKNRKIIEIFTSAELAKACGKEKIVYMLIINGFTELFEKYYIKYKMYNQT